jgi:hypothetical protein
MVALIPPACRTTQRRRRPRRRLSSYCRSCPRVEGGVLTEPRTAERELPRGIRGFVYGFLGLLLLFGLVGVEAWPFSGFRLFSSMRSDERGSWEIVWVDPAQHEEGVTLAELPVAYRNTSTIIAEFDDMTVAERDEVCDAWVGPLRERGTPVERVRIYQRTTFLGDDRAPPTRELRWECGA